MASVRVDALLAEGVGRLTGDEGGRREQGPRGAGPEGSDMRSEARAEAMLLLQRALGRDRAWLYAHADAAVDASQAATFRDLVAARARGVPVAQLLGARGFWTLELAVSADTLIPRPETELLVEAALAHIPATAQWSIVDLGTGTGAIALAIASERPRCHVLAVELSEAALEVARGNAGRHGIGNVEFAHGSWWQPLAGRRFHVAVSNPPYIAESDPHLSQGDLRFEPRTALASGPEGLDALREIIAGAPQMLHEDGWLLVEHGSTQGPAVRALCCDAGLRAVETLRDLERRERVTIGRR